MSTIAILAVALYAGWAAAASLEPEQRPSSEQATRRLDAGAYRGLLSARERADKLTQNPQSVTATVDDSLPPLKHDDPRLTVPFHERLILIGACEADAIVLAVPSKGQPFLNPEETWIFTRYQLRVSNVLKSDDGHLVAGNALVYVHPSGETTLRAQKISTEVTNYPLLRLGNEYLFFVKRIERTGHYRAVIGVPVFEGIDMLRAHAGVGAQVPKRLEEGLRREAVLSTISAAQCPEDRRR